MGLPVMELVAILMVVVTRRLSLLLRRMSQLSVQLRADQWEEKKLLVLATREGPSQLVVASAPIMTSLITRQALWQLSCRVILLLHLVTPLAVPTLMWPWQGSTIQLSS